MQKPSRRHLAASAFAREPLRQTDQLPNEIDTQGPRERFLPPRRYDIYACPVVAVLFGGSNGAVSSNAGSGYPPAAKSFEMRLHPPLFSLVLAHPPTARLETVMRSPEGCCAGRFRWSGIRAMATRRS